MEPLFENKTKCTDKEYDKFLETYQKEYALSDRINTIFYLIFFIFCIIFAIKEKEIILSVVLVVAMIIFIWYKFVRPYNIIKKSQEKSSMQKYICNYKFYKNNFTVNAPDGKATIYYHKLYKIIETNTHFYIFITKENGFIVSKKGFTKGEVKEFPKFISSKVLFKYKNRIDKKDRNKKNQKKQ